MSRLQLCAAILLASLGASSANAAVIMTASTTQPTLDAYDQFQLLDSAVIPAPGNTTPGGGAYNSQAYSDNAGPPGQTFTTEGSVSTALPLYSLQAFSFKGASTGGPNVGGIGAATWSIRISSVSGTTLTPVRTYTGITTPAGTINGNEWFTWTFSGSDIVNLLPTSLYAFEVYSSTGYLGFDAEQGDGNYLLGTAFNSAGPIRSFADTTLGNLANHGYDRTFIANLDPAAVPEPAAATLALGGMLAVAVRRRRSA
jgi:hypothetical protein